MTQKCKKSAYERHCPLHLTL